MDICAFLACGYSYFACREMQDHCIALDIVPDSSLAEGQIYGPDDERQRSPSVTRHQTGLENNPDCHAFHLFYNNASALLTDGIASQADLWELSAEYEQTICSGRNRA